MINSVNPISNNAVSLSYSTYSQAQSIAKQVAQVVYGSLEMISGSKDQGLSVQDLENIKLKIEDASATKSSAYKLVNTLIDRFNALSLDGKNITVNDFVSSVKFSVAQSFSSSTNLYNALRPSGNSFASSLVNQYGLDNLKALDLMQLMDVLPESTVNKMIANLNSSQNVNENQSKIKFSNEQDEIQDYRTVTKEQLQFPINIAI